MNLTRTKYQYSYPDGDDLVFIHPETFERITIHKDKIDGVEFLKENEMVDFVIDTDTDKIILTGGDATFFSRYIDYKHELDNNLVLKGIDYLVRFNAFS